VSPRAKEVLITRFRLSHACLNNFVYRMGLKDNSECALCKEEEHVEYFFFYDVHCKTVSERIFPPSLKLTINVLI